MRIINPRLGYAGLQIQRDKRDKIKKPAQQGSIINAEDILLRFPSQNRTFSEPKTYGFRTKTVRFWDGNRRMKPSGNRFMSNPAKECYLLLFLKMLDISFKKRIFACLNIIQ